MTLQAGDQVRVTGDHPWTGARGEIVSGPSGMLRLYRCRLVRNDALDGHEFYASARDLELDA